MTSNIVDAVIKTTLRSFLNCAEKPRSVSVTVQGKDTQHLHGKWDYKTTSTCFYNDEKCSELNLAVADIDVISTQLRNNICLEVEYNAMEDNDQKYSEQKASWMTIVLLDNSDDIIVDVSPQFAVFKDLKEGLLNVKYL